MTNAAPSDDITLTHWLGHRASDHGQRTAVTFVDDDQRAESWTYQQLWARASVVARRLPQVDQEAPRALLLFPPGLDFLAGFFGCQIAGWIPVPTCYPRPAREMPRLDSAANDCSPSAIVADQATLDGIDPSKLTEVARKLPRIATDVDSDSAIDSIDPHSIRIDSHSLAFLQYTSGSTSEPKGVMITHRNLMSNLESIRLGFQMDFHDSDDNQRDCGVFWLPFFHDMGLIGGILQPLYTGGQTVLMSPRSFLQRPLRWLQCISKYGSVISGAPNFAYQLCVDRISPEQTNGLDLSQWRVAFSGAEPILPRTLSDFANRFAACGFSSSSFYPCYGLAEATLLASGGDGPGEPTVVTVDRASLAAGKALVQPGGHGRSYQKFVGCGTPADGTEIIVVDPETRRKANDHIVGEIWLRGDSVSGGYWNRAKENESRFGAQTVDGQSGYFRSGDLGFLHAGQLFVTARIKDVIILRGRNHFPHDIEATVRATMGKDSGHCAAFAVEGARGEALAIVAELPRRYDSLELPDLARSIRRAIIDVHEVDPKNLLLVRQATIPLTSSGKIRRSRCREMFAIDQFQSKFRYDRSSGSEQTPIPLAPLPANPSDDDRQRIIDVIEAWITQWLVVRAGVDPDDIDPHLSISQYGLDSLAAVELSGEIEDWADVSLTPVAIGNHPTVSELSSFIAAQIVAGDDAKRRTEFTMN